MKKHIHGDPGSFGLLFAAIIFLFLSFFSLHSNDQTSFIVFLVAGTMLGGFSVILLRKRHSDFSKYVKMITAKRDGMSGDAISKFPLPMAVLQINGRISWFNDLFADMIGTSELYNLVIGDIIPDLRWSEILKSTGNICTYANYKGHKYNIVGDIIKSEFSTDDKPDFTVLLYFIDKTEIENLKKLYEDERTDIAIINIDNYDEIFQKMDDSEAQQTMAKINKYIDGWVSESKGILKKTERDRYLMFFEHQYLKEYIQKKFDILEKVRSLGETLKLPITISIGIGVGGSLIENNAYSRAAIDMALGRGGDQAAIKDSTQYSFFGGIAKDYEKSTRVNARAFAVAMRDFILNSENVIFMGHTALDYDAFGAAIGLQRAVRVLGKKPYIIMDNSPGIKPLMDEVEGITEYAGLIISPDEAKSIVNVNTLLVVLDTHRPSMLPCPELLSKTAKIVLIDHHRRSTDFISNISLVYHEPYSSSTCEMASEILQYIDSDRRLTPFEAKALYVGILTDTKNFSVKTGVRTFESASYLRRYGLNTTEVRRLLCTDKEEYIRRAQIIQNSVAISTNMLISVCREDYPNLRVTASRAADEMLNISGITAAFVLYRSDDKVCLSARSLGEVNVQVIAEKIGGGGHATVAGAQLDTTDFGEAFGILRNAISDYVNENRKD